MRQCNVTLDFTDSDGQITISPEQQSDRLKLTIYNDGRAIPEYVVIDKVFDRFYSLPRANWQKAQAPDWY